MSGLYHCVVRYNTAECLHNEESRKFHFSRAYAFKVQITFLLFVMLYKHLMFIEGHI